MLEARRLSKSYGRHPALVSLDLRVRSGEIMGLLGGNGAGKTTTIHLFMGFIQPTSGEAFVDGLSVYDHREEARQRLAYVPENVSLYPLLTGRENLKYFTRLAGLEGGSDQLEDALERVGLEAGARDEPVSSYSKGMRQRVGLAIALAKGAKALLLDEPLSGLDPGAATQFCARLRDLASHGVAVLMSTHDLFRAKEVTDHIGVMQSGRLVATASTRGLGHAELEAMYLRPSTAGEGSPR